jgi:hypothetical protein
MPARVLRWPRFHKNPPQKAQFVTSKHYRGFLRQRWSPDSNIPLTSRLQAIVNSTIPRMPIVSHNATCLLGHASPVQLNELRMIYPDRVYRPEICRGRESHLSELQEALETAMRRFHRGDYSKSITRSQKKHFSAFNCGGNLPNR